VVLKSAPPLVAEEAHIEQFVNALTTVVDAQLNRILD
jgi:hypothetical protein